MTAPEIFWSLYNKKSDVQIDSLRLSQAKAIVSSLNAASWPLWMAWHEGLNDWQLVSSFRELFDEQSTSRIPPAPPTSPPRFNPEPPKTKIPELEAPDTDATSIHKVKAFTSQDFDVDDPEFILQKYAATDARLHSRFQKSFAVTIRFDIVKAECRTIDMSLGGMKIDRLLPSEACGVNITAEIKRRDAVVILECKAIPEPNIRGSTRLMIIKVSDEELLRGWLLEPGGK
jgi:hypothetical protein